MKKNFYFFAASLLLAFCGACSQDDGKVYNLDGRVYFYEQKKQGNDYVAVTSKSYSFALQNSALMEDTLRIKVRLMGYVVDYDRTFSAVTVADGTTAVAGTHYKLLPGVLKAGTYESYLPVILYRTADTKDHTVSLNLRLSTDAELPAGVDDRVDFSLEWGDILTQPDNWPYYFGVYNVNKYRFAIDVLGIYDWPQAGRETSGKEEGVYTISELQRFCTQLNDAYVQYRAQYGPIYNDDNAEVKTEIYFAPDK